MRIDLPFAPLIAAYLPHLPSAEIAAFVHAGIDILDQRGGDCDLEDDDPAESGGDDLDAGWPEWDQRGRRHYTTGAGYESAPMPRNHAAGGCDEDAEDDDPPEDSDGDVCGAGDDGCGPISLGFGIRWGSEFDDNVHGGGWAEVGDGAQAQMLQPVFGPGDREA